ncbi:HAD superfamily (subfamily IIIA) phosphatase, TIGR01668 [Syntrophobotulus glycolicus DSM 8271]|uniref:HAD superfamily (Subfamily IIIA) phosphatase, TIGR01668 n=1 Tax=Syntrophobotulus glycolicus (strain DSM 8271 / FlGlyR) TaxID=645991 RepID=F0T0U2_SYNGF|nr:YqeG family HAD IIIA-type phosphatase [Syntrophobotulus glycolicus]ADY56231.1 HAD superfamily (subfamily IIIA) phosphatase, TIGR01668 [Syntrophobotulus glycolicus DSM 8271]
MIGLLKPTLQFEAIYKVPVSTLLDMGIGGLLLDLDNTIARWNDSTLTDDVVKWFEHAGRQGMKSCIISNNSSPERVARIAERLGIHYVFKAAKPRKKAFLMGIEVLGLEPDRIVVIGDQLFTDVLGANRVGLKSILVNPLFHREFAGTKVLRLMERMVGRRTVFSEPSVRVEKK